MSESFDVVVFHVLEDGETVADRARVNVLQCFDNEVWFGSGVARILCEGGGMKLREKKFTGDTKRLHLTIHRTIGPLSVALAAQCSG